MPKGKPFTPRVRPDMPKGMFSTLEDLIEAAPQERMSAKQWKEYLAPGRILEREGVKFPLKKEEVDYTRVEDHLGLLSERGDTGTVEKADLLNLVKIGRPKITKRKAWKDPSEQTYSQYSTQGPRRLGYFENQTTSPDFGGFNTHFGDDVLSWQRGSTHALGPDPRVNPEAKGVLRLIDEIQSDRHSAAAEKVPNKEFDRLTQEAGSQLFRDNEAAEQSIGQLQGMPSSVRRGYRTPEQEANLHGMRSALEELPDNSENYESRFNLQAGINDFRKVPPDAPFKSPADYGRLEIKKAMLDAVNAGDQYVGITPSAGPIDWFNFNTDRLDLYDPVNAAELAEAGELNPQIMGSRYAYDKIYPGELRKLAQQYGAPVSDLDVPVTTVSAGRVPALQEMDMDLPDFLDTAHDFLRESEELGVSHYHDLLESYEETLPDTPEIRKLVDKVSGHLEKMESEGDNVSSYDTSELEGLFYKLDEAHRRGAPETDRTRKVPSMELTPEVVEKIKKAGIPLWAITGGVVGADALMDQDRSTGYSVGGAVSDADDGYDPANFPELAEHSAMVGDALTPHRTPGLQRARKLAELPGSEGGKNRRKHLLTGLLTQLYGLDTQDNPSFLGYDKDRNSHLQLGSPIASLLSKLRPGLVDETLALPSYFGLNNRVSDKSAEDIEYLEHLIKGELNNTDEQDTVGDDLSYNLGIMLGQLPVPGSAAKTAITKVGPGVLKALGRGAKKVGSSAVEFFSPIITPRPGNYAAGAAFGTGMSTGSRNLLEMIEDAEESEEMTPEEANALVDWYSGDQQYAAGGAVGGDPRTSSPKTPPQFLPQMTPTAQAGLYDNLNRYGMGPERNFHPGKSFAPLDVDFSDWSMPETDAGKNPGSTANKVAGVLSTLPAVWKGIGMADKFLGTGMQEGIKGWGKGALAKLGIGGTQGVTGSLSGTGLAGLNVGPTTTTLPASLGGTGAPAAAPTAAAPSTALGTLGQLAGGAAWVYGGHRLGEAINQNTLGNAVDRFSGIMGSASDEDILEGGPVDWGGTYSSVYDNVTDMPLLQRLIDSGQVSDLGTGLSEVGTQFEGARDQYAQGVEALSAQYGSNPARWPRAARDQLQAMKDDFKNTWSHVTLADFGYGPPGG